jgi:hypothetical protein
MKRKVFGKLKFFKAKSSDLIKNIRDPEKPLTLEELGIITEDSIQITGKRSL